MRINPPIRRLRMSTYLVGLVVAATLPVLGFAAFLFWRSVAREAELGYQQAETAATLLAAAVERELEALATGLEVLAAHPGLRAGDLAAFHAYAGTALGDRVDSVAVFEPDGRLLLNTQRPFGDPLPALPDPAILAPVLERDGMVVSDLLRGPITGRPIFLLLRPIKSGEHRRVVAIGMFADRFQKLVAAAPEGWITGILDRNAVLVARWPSPERFVGEQVVPGLQALIRTAPHGRVQIVTKEGVETITAFRRVPTHDWVVVTGARADLVERPAHTQALVYGALGVGLILPGFLAAGWLGLRLTGSMRRLAKAARALGAGHWPRLAGRPAACVELDLLAHQLAEAAGVIQARSRELAVQRDAAESRSHELAVQSQALERSNTELEQFAYVASHDLREPLRMVTNYLSLLERRCRDDLDDEAREFIGYARDGARRMDRMIRDLLEYSRIGRQGRAFAPVAVAEVIATALHNLDVALQESGATVRVVSALPTVAADDDELTRLFQNLIGNALKYRDAERRPEVEIEAVREGALWRFAVTDNGIGIPPEHADRIFLVFQRLHGRGEYDGTGVGLAICQKIVERHGGRLWVESESGRGSSFLFTLPAA